MGRLSLNPGREWLEANKGRSIKDIARECGVSVAAVSKWMKKEGILLDLPSVRNAEPYREVLEAHKHLPIRVVAEKLGMKHHQTLCNWYRALGIERVDHRGKHNPRRENVVEELESLAGYSLREAGAIMGVSKQRVWQLYRKYGVERVDARK